VCSSRVRSEQSPGVGCGCRHTGGLTSSE
jgi:hypothetical protein